MPEGRPYDPNLLNKMLQQSQHGPNWTGAGPQLRPNINPPNIPNPSVVHNPNFEAYPGRIERVATAIANLRLLATAEGRAERAGRTADRLQHRIDAARYIGQRIMNPRRTTDPREKIGWVGDHVFGDTPMRPEQQWNLGKRLMDDKNIHDRFAPGYIPRQNMYRPNTASTEAVSRRIGGKMERARALRRDTRWLDDTSGGRSIHGVLNADMGYTTSRKERARLGRQARHMVNNDERAARIEQSAARVADSTDWRGAVIRGRLQHARARAAMPAARQQARMAHPGASRRQIRRMARQAAQAQSRLPHPPHQYPYY